MPIYMYQLMQNVSVYIYHFCSFMFITYTALNKLLAFSYIISYYSITIITSQSKLPNREITCKDVSINLQIITIIISHTHSPTIIIISITITFLYPLQPS